MEKIQLRDFLEFTFLSSLRLDGEVAYFVGKKAEEKKDEYRSCLYRYQQGKAEEFIPDDFGGFYCLEEGKILFSKAKKEEEKGTSFARLDLKKNAIVDAFKFPFPVGEIKPVKKGVYLLSTIVDLDDPKAHLKEEKKKEEDYQVLTEMPFYFNGKGYIDRKREVLYLYEEKTGKLTPLWESALRLQCYELTEKGVYYAADKGKDKETFKHDLYFYDFAKKKATKLLSTGLSVFALKWWNNVLVLWGADDKAYGVNENPGFYTYNPKTAKIYPLAVSDDGCGSTVLSDVHLGGGRILKEDGNALYYLTTIRNHSEIRRLDPFGRMETVVDVEGGIVDFDVVRGDLYVLGDYSMKPTELCHFEKGKMVKLTSFNEKPLKGKYVAKPRKITVQSCDTEIDGWILPPLDYDAKKKYPAILDIHGGPKCAYGEVYYHEMQVWASLGYFVIFANPVGGDGRGDKFADIRGRYGSIDYQNLMDFVDVVLSKYPSIDPKRLGVTGGSYGGFMTNWIVTHTKRFACAATQRSISNWLSMAGTSDIGYLFAEDQCGGKLFTDDGAEMMWERSPLKYAGKLATPLLVIHSECDYRCPLEQGLQIYSAAKERGVDARMVIFKGENHDLSRSGKPSHRVRRLEEITRWFEKYLKPKAKK